MSGVVVVDASLAFKWLVWEPQSGKALTLLRSWDRRRQTGGSSPPAFRGPRTQAGRGLRRDLALAATLDCELWTADERFFRAASAVSSNVRWLGEFVEAEHA